MTQIRERLMSMQDLGYRDFHAALIPQLDKRKIIGVRMPALRALERELRGGRAAEDFLTQLPHEYYDEYALHGLLISAIGDFAQCIAELERFLPYVDNWAVCDLTSPKCFKKHRKELATNIDRWLDSGETYTVRFGIVMLMTHFLDEDFRPEYLERVAAIRTEEYYVQMAQAWYFATALAKQYDAAVKLLVGRRLDRVTHNKAIQKARESYRVTAEHKEYLRTLKY